MNTSKKIVSRYKEQTEYRTKDGSMIRELMHSNVHNELGVKNQSLAEACVKPGMTTSLHKHHKSEELYHIVSGRGLMCLGSDKFAVEQGDSVCIPPGTEHCITAVGDQELRILCCCSPTYSHEDTELID